MQKCPQCGYQEFVDNKPRSSIMNHYVNPKTKEVSILNHPDKEVMVGPEGKQEKYIRQDVWEKMESDRVKAEALKPKTPTPVVPVTPVAPIA